MYKKSYVKLLIINFILLYIFKVQTLYIRQELNSTVTTTSIKNVTSATTTVTSIATSNKNPNITQQTSDPSEEPTKVVEAKVTTTTSTRTSTRKTKTSTTTVVVPTSDAVRKTGPSMSGNMNIPLNSDEGDDIQKVNDGLAGLFSTVSVVAVVCCCVVGLIAVSGYRVVRKKNESKMMKSQGYYSSTNPSSFTDSNNNRSSLVNSLIYENESGNSYMYFMGKNEPYSTEIVSNNPDNGNETKGLQSEPQIGVNGLPYQVANKNEKSKRKSVISVNRSSVTSVTSVSRNSIIRHSFLNPNLNIVRTSKRTQQLFEATSDHPAIIETFPSLERPFEPAVPVPLEESDVNSLHPHSIYQMYQDEMEYENYYAYTIDDKEYIIDPTTNRVLEIHDLVTDEYMLVEEELYLDFSGSSSEDSDSEKQSL